MLKHVFSDKCWEQKLAVSAVHVAPAQHDWFAGHSCTNFKVQALVRLVLCLHHIVVHPWHMHERTGGCPYDAHRWAAWKADGCKGFEREEAAPLAVLPLSPLLKAAAPPVQNRVETGSDPLDRHAPGLVRPGTGLTEALGAGCICTTNGQKPTHTAIQVAQHQWRWRRDPLV